MTTVPWTQFDAQVLCGNCSDGDEKRNVTTLITMRYESMLPTMKPWLKLHRVKRRGAARVRQPNLADTAWPAAFTTVSRAKLERMDPPAKPDDEIKIECPRCGSTRTFVLAKSFTQAVEKARRDEGATLPKVRVWI